MNEKVKGFGLLSLDLILSHFQKEDIVEKKKKENSP